LRYGRKILICCKRIVAMRNMKEVERIRADFINAIDRIVLGIPNSEKLIELNLKGKLKLNVSNVAIEANRSRTLIATRNENYIDIRDMILRPSGNRVNRSSSIDTVEKLRGQIKTMKEEIVLLREAQTAAFYELDKATVDARRWRDAYKRLKDEVDGKLKIKHLKILPLDSNE